MQPVAQLAKKRPLLLHCSRFSYSQDQDLRLTVRPCMKSATPDGPVVRERHNRAKRHNYCRSTDHDPQASEDSPARRDGPKRQVLNALANATRQGRTDRGAACLQKLERALHHGPSRIARRIPHETSDTKGGPRCPPTLPHRSYIPLVHGRSLWKELLGPGKD